LKTSDHFLSSGRTRKRSNYTFGTSSSFFPPRDHRESSSFSRPSFYFQCIKGKGKATPQTPSAFLTTKSKDIFKTSHKGKIADPDLYSFELLDPDQGVKTALYV
jgi:hypothetical protein